MYPCTMCYKILINTAKKPSSLVSIAIKYLAHMCLDRDTMKKETQNVDFILYQWDYVTTCCYVLFSLF